LELLALEHGLGKDGGSVSSTSGQMPSGFYSFFEESSSGKYSPRSIFMDLDPTVIDELRTGEYARMIKPQLLIKGKEDAANNFARGRYTIGKDILDTTLDVFRRVVEKCGSLQGFVLTHSIGGGCGSGFTSLLLEHIVSDLGVKKNILDYCVFPSDASLCVVEPYNAVLSAPALIEYTNVTFPFDNQTLGTSRSV
jgi:tubulin alpha